MESRINYFSVGLFVLILMVAAVFASIWILGDGAGRHYKLYEVYFQGSVTGLREGSHVRYRGVPVGLVKDIAIDPTNVEQIRVRVGIDRGTPIKEDAVASLELQGITGMSYIQISGGTQESALLKAKGKQRYPIIASKASRFENVIESAPQLLENISALTKEVAALFSLENRDMFAQVIKNLERVSGVFSEKSNDIEALVTDTRAALKQLEKTLVAVEGGMDDVGGQAFKTLEAFENFVKENRSAVTHFTGIGMDQFIKLVTDIRTTVAGMNRIIDRVERSPSRFLFGDSDGTVRAK